MAVLLNVQQIIEGRVVENERIEYKKGWNPEDILHSICAFANDIEGINGGYIIVGIQDKDGIPDEIVGVSEESVDGLNAKLLDLCNRIDPRYIAYSDYNLYKGVGVFVIHAPSGYDRPYTCPVSLSTKKPERASYIRKLGRTIRANSSDVKYLTQISSVVPFEDRANKSATIADLDLGLILGFLTNTKSNMLKTSRNLDVETLAERMHLLQNSPEGRLPTNLSLMFFNRNPEDFFPRSWIEIAYIPEPTGLNMKEHTIRGPIDQQIVNALAVLEDRYIEVGVTKHTNGPNSDRCYSYPPVAVREAVVNAIYHRGYDSGKPVKIHILKDRMEITSAPGPDPSITDEDLLNGRLITRYNRNIRLGDFLKSLGLAEGMGTGIPMMQEAMSLNGSDPPKYETDAGRTYFTVILPINPMFLEKDPKRNRSEVRPASSSKGQSKEEAMYNTIISLLKENGPMSTNEIATAMGYESPTSFLRSVLRVMIASKRIGFLYPDSPRAARQKIILIDDGD